MLQQVFQSQPLQYARTGASFFKTLGLFYGPRGEQNQPTTFFFAATEDFLSSYAYVWDATTGKFIGRLTLPIGGVGISWIAGLARSKMGQLYWNFHGGSPNLAPVEYPSFVIIGPGIDGYYNNPAIDESLDYFMDGDSVWSVRRKSTMQLLWQIDVPDSVVSSTIADNGKVYLLCNTGLLVTLDYLNKRIIGATKLQPTNPAATYISITFDPVFRRILVFEESPNNPDGTSNCIVKGFALVPQAVRITKPIPLKYPKAGRTIPVLSQVVGDLNEGLGGALVNTTVSGEGELVTNTMVTGSLGQVISQVKCDQQGSFTITVNTE